MISVLIADKNYLSRLGLFTLLNTSSNFEVDYTEDECFENLLSCIRKSKPKILVLDFQSFGLSAKQISFITKTFKRLQVLAITDYLSRAEMQGALDAGIRSYLLKECDKEEIIEALHATYNGERFLCGKVAYFLSSNTADVSRPVLDKISCQGLGITDRELDVIRLISEGLSNKLIADKLELSTHTVNTHRKNIMTKLDIPNTAGIVMFAVKNNLLVA
ncbi:MAG: two component transcriptional regulator, LuxR family [Bacteroidota bacterium]|jgi:DNA-binding NarL/FixJ family response regulator|nr:two component transcriptional regulator, LuxR family [Bacteroidota bacterium]